MFSLGYADAHTIDNLSDCFNFDQVPQEFKTVEAPLKSDYFVNDTRVPNDPDTE